jgi:hypothetical protein
LWVSFFLTFVELALDWRGSTRNASGAFVVGSAAITSAIQAWLYLKIARGRNWARITILVLIAISMPAVLIVVPEVAARAPWTAFITVVDLLLVFYALYLLFFPGREWFRRRRD